MEFDDYKSFFKFVQKDCPKADTESHYMLKLHFMSTQRCLSFNYNAPIFEWLNVAYAPYLQIGKSFFGAFNLKKSFGIVVAAKFATTTATKIDREVHTMMCLNGNSGLPHLFGILQPSTILVEFIGTLEQTPFNRTK